MGLLLPANIVKNHPQRKVNHRAEPEREQRAHGQAKDMRLETRPVRQNGHIRTLPHSRESRHPKATASAGAGVVRPASFRWLASTCRKEEQETALYTPPRPAGPAGNDGVR